MVLRFVEVTVMSCSVSIKKTDLGKVDKMMDAHLKYMTVTCWYSSSYDIIPAINRMVSLNTDKKIRVNDLIPLKKTTDEEVRGLLKMPYSS